MVLSRRRARGGSRASAAHLAGWLFADLLLVLFLVSLSAQQVPEEELPEPRAEETPPPPELLSRESCEFVLENVGSGFDVDEERTVGEFTRVLTDPDPGDFNTDEYGDPGDKCLEHLAEERPIGFVIIFGRGSDQQITAAKEFAEEVVETARAEVPQFEEAQYRGLWGGGSSGDAGDVEVSLFFLE